MIIIKPRKHGNIIFPNSTDAAEEETVYWRKKRPEATPKKRSVGRGRREVVSERRRERERRRKRRMTKADCREVKKWTGVRPLRRGSESVEIRAWWTKATRRHRMRR